MSDDKNDPIKALITSLREQQARINGTALAKVESVLLGYSQQAKEEFDHNPGSKAGAFVKGYQVDLFATSRTYALAEEAAKAYEANPDEGTGKNVISAARKVEDALAAMHQKYVDKRDAVFKEDKEANPQYTDQTPLMRVAKGIEAEIGSAGIDLVKARTAAEGRQPTPEELQLFLPDPRQSPVRPPQEPAKGQEKPALAEVVKDLQDSFNRLKNAADVTPLAKQSLSDAIMQAQQLQRAPKDAVIASKLMKDLHYAQLVSGDNKTATEGIGAVTETFAQSSAQLAAANAQGLAASYLGRGKDNIGNINDRQLFSALSDAQRKAKDLNEIASETGKLDKEKLDTTVQAMDKVIERAKQLGRSDIVEKFEKAEKSLQTYNAQAQAATLDVKQFAWAQDDGHRNQNASLPHLHRGPRTSAIT